MNNKQRHFAIEMLTEAYFAKQVTGLPASILASQCILETSWGKYIPIDISSGKYSYNLFGIKGKGTNGSVEVYTHEYINGKKIKIKDKFRAYDSYKESFIDYGNLILGAKRYKQAVVNKDNPRKYIEELWKAGYATDPDYVSKVIHIAEQCKFIPKC
ncbi:MAG: glucosaminidase domain-containing protein [Actinomycetota bacterium]|nr:glucosaminidase domain-containing protein [Actinomycetota bacterium]